MSIRDEVHEVIVEVIKDCEHLVKYGKVGDSFLQQINRQWHTDIILLLFKDYRNINEPIMKECPKCIVERKSFGSLAKTVGCQCNNTGEVSVTLKDLIKDI